MKTHALLPLFLVTVASASAQSSETVAPSFGDLSLRLQSDDRLALAPRLDPANSLTPAPAPPDDIFKNGQVWVGIGLSYEHFAGDKAGDEFGFSPTNYLGYQRNFYPTGRLSNGVGYSLGIGAAALGAAVFYHQGARKGVDFRAGIAADFVYYRNFSYFGDASYFNLVPFVEWGIKI